MAGTAVAVLGWPGGCGEPTQLIVVVEIATLEVVAQGEGALADRPVLDRAERRLPTSLGGRAAWPTDHATTDPATTAPVRTLPTADAPPRQTPPATAGAPPAVEVAPTAVEPATIEVAVTTRPAGATLRLDGDVVAPPFVLPRDGREHELTIVARGFRRERRAVVADRDQNLEVVLARRPGRRGARLPRRRGSGDPSDVIRPT